MKKLMKAVAAAAVALVASSSFATIQTTAGFENFQAGALTIGDLVNVTDGGQSTGDKYWFAITNDSVATTEAIGSIVADSGNQYLALEAQAPLYRTVNTSGDFGAALTAEDAQPQTIDDGIYLDTMVKFTISQDAFKDGDLENVDKLAITCYSADESTDTNILVRAGYVDGSSITPTNYFLNLPANFDADAWHRLTVRAIASVGNSQVAQVGFAIYLDQNLLTYSTEVAAGDSDYVGSLNAAVQQYLYNNGTHALLPSLVADGATNYNKLSAVGFKGTGCLDDVVFTDDKPSFIVENNSVTIAWDAGVATYTVVDNFGVTNINAEAVSVAGSTNLTLAADITSLTVTATYKEGYEAGDWNGNFTVENGATLNIRSMLPKFDVGGTHYGSFADALAAAVSAGTSGSPATIQLMGDVSELMSFDQGFIILDLNGNTINSSGASARYVIANQGATLKIIDTATGGIVKAGSSGSILVKGDAAYTTIEAGTYEGTIVFNNQESVQPENLLVVKGGRFYDADYAEESSEVFYLTAYVDTTTYTITGPDAEYYFTVGEGEPEPPKTGWAKYLGDAVDGAYLIDDADDLIALSEGVAAGLTSSNVTFKQTANIDMTGKPAFAGIGEGGENGDTLTNKAFEGIYDGNNKTISNVTFTNRKGSGIFNLVRGATIKDLTVDTVSYEASFNAAKLGGAMIVGNGVSCTLQHLITTGSNGLNNPSTYNAAGIANRLEGRGGPVLVIGCTNNAAIYGCYSKVGGICPIVQGADQTVTFVDCANNGTIVANGTSEQTSISGKTPGMDGAAGILAYTQGGNNLLSFTNCVNTGTITGVSGSRVASILGYTTASGITIVGGAAQADMLSVHSGADKVTGAKFATVDNGVATFVDDSAFALNGEYKVMSGNAAATFVFAEAGTIAFDTNLTQNVTFDVTAPGLDLSEATADGVVTFTAKAPSSDDWDDNPADIPAGTTAAEEYTALAGTALATADAKKLTTWAKAKNVEFSDVKTDADSYVDAFLLNCAPADVETAKENFKATITVNADGTVTVTAPGDYNVTPTIQGKQTLDGTWHDKTTGDKFFRAVLSL